MYDNVRAERKPSASPRILHSQVNNPLSCLLLLLSICLLHYLHLLTNKIGRSTRMGYIFIGDKVEGSHVSLTRVVEMATHTLNRTTDGSDAVIFTRCA